MSLAITELVPLAPLTTFGLGGAARFLVDIADASEVAPALAWASEKNLPTFILGGGSNLVVADEGFPGLVLRMRTAGRRWREQGGELRVEVEAGETWDDLVADAIHHDAAGIECLSGIPGSAGAAPVQNIGAYGQEVATVLRRVRVLDRGSRQVREIEPGACGFGYRDSMWKREPDRSVILSITLGLGKGGKPAIRYAELASALAGAERPSLAQARQTVLALRRKKSMVLDDADANRHSAGSFFTNPTVPAAIADDVASRALATGLAGAIEDVPRFPLADGRVKLSAGWLIERSGLAKGFRMGPVGISSQHALALVHHGGGSTADLVRLAAHVHKTVLDRFGVSLVPEPVFLGLRWRP